MYDQKQKITVVGAGTAGAIATAFLQVKLPEYEIYHVYTKEVPTIGVGESVTPHVNSILKDIGINEYQWMKDTGAIFKYGNNFEKWVGEEDYCWTFDYNFDFNFINKFKELKWDTNIVPYGKDFKITSIWCDLYKQNKVKSFTEDFSNFNYYILNNAAPYDENLNYQGNNNIWQYAYHFDANLLGPWIIKNVVEKSDVVTYNKKIVKINADKTNIHSVIFEDGTEHTSDIWIDCTGFHRLLISKVTNEWVEWEHTLTNSACVMPVELENQTHNYTRSIWDSHGWQFKIDLQHRSGTGLVYSDHYFTDDYIIDYYLKKEKNKRIQDPKIIKWNPGRYKYPNTGNVFAIGLAAGFVEPMEANALFMTCGSLYNCLSTIKNYINQEEYNRRVGNSVDDIADFVSVHYTLCEKGNNKFWDDMRSIGKKFNHKELLLKKYQTNTNDKLYTNEILFYDYMWAHLSAAYLKTVDGFEANSSKEDQIKLLKYIETIKTKPECHYNYRDFLKDYFK
jgi:tryptophan halogenase